MFEWFKYTLIVNIEKYKMRGLSTVLFFLFLTTNAVSQTIVNTEKLFQEDSSKFKFASELTGSLTSGNASVFLFGYSANAAYHSGKNELMLLTGGVYLNENDEIISNSHFGQLRYTYLRSRWFNPYVFYQLQSNEILLLQRRQLAGIGNKMNLFKINRKDSLELFSSKLSLGVMLEEEVLAKSQLPPGERLRTLFPRASVNWVFVLTVNNVLSVINTTYYQPYFADFLDFRLLNETNFIFAVTDKLSFSMDFEIRYDSKPPSTLKNTDINSNFGILVQF